MGKVKVGERGAGKQNTPFPLSETMLTAHLKRRIAPLVRLLLLLLQSFLS